MSRLEDMAHELHVADYAKPKDQVLPKPDDGDFAWARAHPGEWQYLVDPRSDRSKRTNANIMGGRRADQNGGFDEVWLNPEFLPTSEWVGKTLSNGFETVLWLAEMGFASVGQFIDAFAHNEFIIVMPADDPNGQRGWPVHYQGDQDQEGFLEVYSSSAVLRKNTNPWLRHPISGRSLISYLEANPQRWVTVNPYSKGGMYLALNGGEVARWWREWTDVHPDLVAPWLRGT
ncbi:hypothetical protein D5S18_25185 [Nocardia panacis]|uniref:Uncharacterized protein n=1 Tax=Nocardia panacis TaxID=2340916 RepID=A0A3A4K1M7_9NOCA|nr:hypothetical protein [Nocardia panacis]RJO71462.1 hypothetical protein D5S18_25185 [Nocardia panacis]